jgi:hypothetical protein
VSHDLIANLSHLLPPDGECSILLRFGHFAERITITGNPFSISLRDDVWDRNNGRRRNTHGDRIEMNLGTGPWADIEMSSPLPNFELVFDTD